MRKSYLRMLLAYTQKVYKIEDTLNKFKYKIRSKDFQGVISRKTKLPQIDVIREVFKRIDLSTLDNFTSSIVKKAKANKVFRNGTIDGYIVAAIDGTKLFGSNIKSKKLCG